MSAKEVRVVRLVRSYSSFLAFAIQGNVHLFRPELWKLFHIQSSSEYPFHSPRWTAIRAPNDISPTVLRLLAVHFTLGL